MSTSTSKNLKEAVETYSPIQLANFWHLYWDVAWFGVLFGSTLSFLSVFATRLGAAGWQLGLLGAGPAIMNVLFTLPAGRWVEKRPLGPAVTKSAIFHRAGYILLIPLPLVLPASIQVWAILVLILLMAIPSTALAVGFNALLASTVPVEARGMVVGRRNALLAGAVMVSFVSSGWILDQLPLALGYAAVFSLGAVGAAMSTYHVYRVQVPAVPQFQGRPVTDRAQPSQVVGFGGTVPAKATVAMRLWLNWRPNVSGSLGNVSNRFWWMMLGYFLFHFTQHLPGALFPIFWVREVKLTDGQIGWINATFYLTMLLASPMLGPLSRRLGNYWLTTLGAVLLAAFPLLTALSTDITLLLVANILGGMIWALLSGALVNRLLESIPENRRPTHLALYNLALNVAMLAGIMLGPVLADLFGLRDALFIIAALRVGSGFALARWG